jgi:hypothetical protein
VSVLEGKAHESILDSYSDERREGAQTNIQITNRTARFLSPKTAVEKMIRNAVIGLAKKFPFARALVNTGRLSTANTYREKPLCIAGKASVPIQNCAVQPSNGFTDLMSIVEKHHYRPMLIAFSLEAQNAALKRGFNETYLVEQYSIQPIVFLSEGDSHAHSDNRAQFAYWPKVVVSEINYARLIYDFGIAGEGELADQLALLRPDLYGAGLLDLNAIEEQLSSLGLKPVVSQKVAV